MNLHTPENETWVRIPYLLGPGEDQELSGALILDFKEVPNLHHHNEWIMQLPQEERWRRGMQE